MYCRAAVADAATAEGPRCRSKGVDEVNRYALQAIDAYLEEEEEL